MPPLLAACEADCARLSGSSHGCAVLYEALGVATAAEGEGEGADKRRAAADKVMAALAAAALQKPPSPSKPSSLPPRRRMTWSS